MSNVRSLRCNNCQGRGYVRPLVKRSAAGLTWGNPARCPECGPPSNRSHGNRVPQDTLADIRSVPRYVNGVVQRHRTLNILLHSFTGAQREEMRLEMIAQGSAVIYREWSIWRPDQCPSFKTYCSTRLPQRIQDWWRTNERQSWRSRRNTTTGTYDQNVAVAFDEDLDSERLVEEDEGGVVEAAIHRLAPWDQELARDFVRLTDLGYGDEDIRERLDVDRMRLAAMRDALAKAIEEVQRAEAA